MTNYNPGQDVTLTGTIKTAAGVATDPTAAALVVVWPQAKRIQTFLSPTGWASQGTWNAATNTPELINGTGTAGHYYTVSAAGVQDLGDWAIAFGVGDRVYYDGDYWQLLVGVQAGLLTHSGVGVFSYDYPIPDVQGAFKYMFLSVGIIKGAATPVVFNVT